MPDESARPPQAAGSDAVPQPRDPFDRPELQALPIELSVRLAAGQLSLGDLVELAPGGFVPLETPVGEPSQLLAGETAIGGGELVEIKGRLAIRLTRLGGADA